MAELSSSQKCGYGCDGRSRWWAKESRCNSERNKLSDNTKSRVQTDFKA